MQHDADDDARARRTLQRCNCARSGLPAIQDFIAKHAAQYGKRLRVVESVGAYPRLILTNKAAGARSSLRIDNWKVRRVCLRTGALLRAAACPGAAFAACSKLAA